MNKQKFKKKALISLLLALALMMTACGKKTEKDEEPTKVEAVKQVRSLTDGVVQEKVAVKNITPDHGKALSVGAVRLLSKVMELGESKDSNYLISPASLQMAFGMLAAGADEGSETEKELMELLMPGINASAEDMNLEMAALAEGMRKEQGVEWNVVNSVWVKKDGNVKFSDEYLSDVVSFYQAELFEAPFDDATLDEINGWVKENTKERIPSILDYLDPQTAYVLLNALSFDGEWASPIDDTMVKEQADFTNSDGTVSKVKMLRTEERGYIEIAGGKGFLKTYKGGAYCFMGLLPPEGVSTEEYLQKILSDKKTLYDAVRNMDMAPELQVEFPEFKAEYGADMVETVRALGVEKSFGAQAEYGKMITADSERIAVDQIEHRAMIEVDQSGTKAAAATAITATEAAMVIDEPEIIKICLDRPFVYGIIDMKSRVPIFLGVQNTIE